MDTQRLLLVVALGLILFMIWDAWEKYQNPPPPQTEIVAGNPAHETGVPAAGEAEVPQAPAAGATARAAAAPRIGVLQYGDRIEVRTDVYHAVIDSFGGDLRIVDLLRYPVSVDEPDKPFRLMNDTLPHLFVAQSGFARRAGAADGALVAAPTHATRFEVKKTRYELPEGQEALDVELFWVSPDGVRFSKRYTFRRGQYAIDVRYRVENPVDRPWRGFYYQQLQRSGETVKAGIGHTYTYTGGVIYDAEDKYQKISFDKMAETPVNKTVTGGWIAMIQHYFLGAWVPPQDARLNIYSLSLPENRFVLGTKMLEETVVAPGETRELVNRLYVGPKLQHVLEKIAPGLELTVDYGILTIIAKPIFWLLEKIHAVIGNWGWAIVILTLLLKLAFYKLSETSYKSMAHMRKVQPRLVAIKERYGDDRQKLNQAMMELYKKEKINPLGGCLPILVQIPVFIALYWVLLESVELRQAPWILWIKDLSTRDPYFVLPLLMGATMFIQQKLNPAPVDPIQAKVMTFLPIVFTFFFLFFPSGLVLYWVVNNTLSIVQQWYITNKVIKD